VIHEATSFNEKYRDISSELKVAVFYRHKKISSLSASEAQLRESHYVKPQWRRQKQSPNRLEEISLGGGSLVVGMQGWLDDTILDKT
jgi:hypothetical protein